jgi:UDP-2,3-diacylglucosamine pyrophosphatase LpxH
MSYALKQISKAYDKAYEVYFDNLSKIVIMSDCHRGDGSQADNFSKNQNIYFVALTHYEKNKYTYIELGDGEELWENKNISDIIETYTNIYWLLSQFYHDNRLLFIYGNHDIVKKADKYVRRYLSSYYDVHQKDYASLFPNIKILESILLKYGETDKKILLLHGHQADYMNSRLWKLSRFLVRYLWRPLELIGINNPTSAAKNNKKKKQIEKILTYWSNCNKQMIIAGHTHRAIMPNAGAELYFNDGSCVHPRCITAIEIENGEISLVKWCYKVRQDAILYIGRDVLEGPVKLTKYFNDKLEEEKAAIKI